MPGGCVRHGGLFFAWACLVCDFPSRQSRRNHPRPAYDLPPQPVTFSIDGPTQKLEMVVATSRILTLQHKIPRLLVNNPDIVRATPISPNQVQAVGPAAGCHAVECVG